MILILLGGDESKGDRKRSEKHEAEIETEIETETRDRDKRQEVSHLPVSCLLGSAAWLRVKGGTNKNHKKHQPKHSTSTGRWGPRRVKGEDG